VVSWSDARDRHRDAQFGGHGLEKTVVRLDPSLSRLALIARGTVRSERRGEFSKTSLLGKLHF